MNWIKYILLVFVLFSAEIVMAETDIPDAPVFISASIIPESDPTVVSLSWNPSDSTAVQGYIVYQVIGDVTETVDTVWGRMTTSYDYNLVSTISKPEKFRLAAFDDLFFKSSITDPHTTMYLNANFDKCTSIVNLDWSAYEGWDNGVNTFKIYRRTESSTYNLITSVSEGTLVYDDEDIDFNQTYYYYIEATSNSGYTATSNSVKLTTNSFDKPLYLHAQSASVEGENIIVNFLVDNSAQVIEYRIQRADSPDGTFSTIKSYPNSGQINVNHIDYDVNVSEKQYYYRIAAVNPCSIVFAYSNTCSNILLSANNDDGFQHDISWTDYYAWPNGVSNYKVFRYFDGVSSEIAVNTSGRTVSSYDIEWYVDYCHDRKIHMSNEFCYYVEAYESESPGYADTQGVSRSNVSCVNHYPVAWMPTAFNATSYEVENRIFKPILSFVEKDSYEFYIFDKWGEEVFHTDQTYEGWDGTINHHNLAPSQYYTYYVKYFDHQGKEYLKTGTFFLFID